MYSTTGVDAIATITELRSKTSELLDHVRETRSSLLIQKNNEAYAVLVDWDTYQSLLERRGERVHAQDRSPHHNNRPVLSTPDEHRTRRGKGRADD